VTTAVRSVVEISTPSTRSVSVATPWGSSMSEDFSAVTCRHCRMSVPTERAAVVETPVGPLTVCLSCARLPWLADATVTEGPYD